MEFKISKSSSAQVSSINLINEKSDLTLFGLNKEEITYLKKRLGKKEYFTHLNRLSKSDFFQFEEGLKDSGNP
ncbi:MAG: hypothetical protein ACOVO9_01155, partial [Bacteroidia bacterium]